MEDSDMRSADRRSVLQTIGTTGVVGGMGLLSATDTAAAATVEDQNNPYNKTINVPNTDIEVQHSVSVTEFEANCEMGDYRQGFQLTMDTIAYDEDDKEEPKDEAIKANMWEMTFPDGTVVVEDDDHAEWGGYPYEEDEGDNYERFAEEAVKYGVSLLPGYGWIIGGGIAVTEMLGYIVEAVDETDRIRNDFVYFAPGRNEAGNLVPQADSWGTFIAEFDGDWLEIDIETGFTIYLAYNNKYTYRDTFTYIIGKDFYC